MEQSRTNPSKVSSTPGETSRTPERLPNVQAASVKASTGPYEGDQWIVWALFNDGPAGTPAFWEPAYFNHYIDAKKFYEGVLANPVVEEVILTLIYNYD